MKYLTKYAFVVYALFTLFCLIYNSFIPIHFDEAYYWLWSKHLALGYFDHPPMVSYVIRLTTLFSDSEFWVRLSALLCNLGGMFFLYRWMKDMYSKETARLGLIFFCTLPLIHINSSFITPDAPMFLFWCMSLFYCYKALETTKTGYFYLTGLSIGLLMLSKLLAAFFILPPGIYILWRRRDLLLNHHLYLAGLLALGLTGGMLWWNSQNGWPTFGYQLNRAVQENAFPNYTALGEYLGGYLLLLGPFFILLSIRGLYSRIRYGGTIEFEKLLFCFTLVIFVFFLYKSLESKIQLNWYAPIVIGIIPVVARDLAEKKQLWLTTLTILLSLALVIIVRFPWIIGIENTPMRNNYGYQQAIERLQDKLQDNDVICSDYHTTASVIRYYLGDQYPVITRFRVRDSQFNLWPDPKPNACIALVKRNKIKPYHKRDCSAITEVQNFEVKVTENYRPNFMIFRCKLKGL